MVAVALRISPVITVAKQLIKSSISLINVLTGVLPCACIHQGFHWGLVLLLLVGVLKATLTFMILITQMSSVKNLL